MAMTDLTLGITTFFQMGREKSFTLLKSLRNEKETVLVRGGTFSLKMQTKKEHLKVLRTGIKFTNSLVTIIIS